MRQRSVLSNRTWIAVLSLMLIIFFFSSQNSELSNSVSDAIAKLFHESSSTVPLVFGLTLRQIAHISIFAALGFVALKFWNCWWKAVLFCYAFAVIDEVHQIFVPGRSAKFADTLLDAVGVGIVILIWFAVKNTRYRFIIFVSKMMNKNHNCSTRNCPGSGNSL